MASLPTQGGDTGTWGTELNTYLRVEHEVDGTHGDVNALGFNIVTYNGEVVTYNGEVVTV